ncbi:RseA family anti-sigma factor [Pseudomonas sp. F1_0610]|uniref:sigma-E factor negative regulatory protein n=1 Tax=Pseudomonas sp. F1_0610 TaxID=3114284 RepID=UPI0039C1F28E
MNNETLQQSISALMDNEADDLQLQRVLKDIDDTEVRATWSRYHMARAAMRQEFVMPQVDLSSSIMAAIENENFDQQAPIAASTKKSRPLQVMGRFAVAASVTLAVLAGVRFYNQDAVNTAKMVAHTQEVTPVNDVKLPPLVELAGFNRDNSSPSPIAEVVSGQTWYEQRLPEYFRRHAQQAPAQANEVGIPFARAASVEGN